MNPQIPSTLAALLASGKGILAADESVSTIGKRFQALNIASTEETRCAYREMLITTPGLSEFISGVIMFNETFRQRTSAGVRMPEALAKLGIVPGIKVDIGTAPLARFAGEKVTLGLDELRERLTEYHALGARFTKWRAVIAIGDSIPSDTCIKANAHALARFAALSQEADLVPIVEPELLMDGTHTVARCEEVSRTTLNAVFAALLEHRVTLEQMLLKPAMILPGAACTEQANVAVVTEATLRCFKRVVPAAVPGIVFLSGGQSDEGATENLNAICGRGAAPWTLSFSFGRALQSPAMKAWSGMDKHVAAAQKALHYRAKCNSLATRGLLDP